MTESKILLFIVEGTSDKVALAPALEKIFTSNTIKFKVMCADITSDFNSNVSNIERRIKKLGVKRFLDENSQFSENDIYGVIHIVDLDGCFAPDSAVIEDEKILNAKYYDNYIICKDRSKFLQSKNNKKQNLLHLCTLKEISIPKGIKVPYSIYYMSCNLDHVLHDERNSSIEEKKVNSITFSDEHDEPQEFINFFNRDDVKIAGTYEETWKFIQIGLNSLLKGSNFWICIK